jgi:hypothetical protein
MMSRTALVPALLRVLLALASSARGEAQAVADTGAQALPACDGRVVTAVTVFAHPPSYNSKAAAAYESMEQVMGVHHATTKEEVVRAYLQLRAGEPCTERDRAESERLLRAQPFLSAAAVRAFPDGPDRVRVRVDVVDEISAIVGGNTARGTLSAVSLGTQNLSGLGVGIIVSWQRGFAYRDGFGARVVQYGAFGSSNYFAVSAERDPLGEILTFEVARPFLTDLQQRAFHIGAAEASSYYGVVRPVGDDVALYTRRTSYDAGWVTRIGAADRGHTVGLIGAAFLGEDVRVGDRAIIASDSGLINAPDSALDARYPALATMRLAGIAGLRALRFVTVRGFDAVRAQQDVGVGVQFDLLAGPSVWASRNESDLLIAGDLYAGVGDAESFYSARLLAEARDNHATHAWDGLVTSARFSWYGRPTDARTRVVSIEGTTVQHLAFPLQLTFRDPAGGLPGFPDATFAGGQRVVARFEERRLIPWLSRRLDLAWAGFADVGKLWAGDVPYGTTTTIRSSVGISLLGAYPAGGKRMLRVDFAVPINPQSGRAKFELRFSDTDRTRLLWSEPGDVARARTGAVPANLMKW